MKTTIQAVLDIHRPPQDVTRVVLDPAMAVRWTSDLERFEVVSGTPGVVGSRARLHYAQGGRTYVMEDVLLEADPGRRYLSRVSGEALEAEVETVLTPIDGGTRVRIRWTGQGKRLLFRLMLPLMRRRIAEGARADLVKLKQLVESSSSSNESTHQESRRPTA